MIVDKAQRERNPRFISASGYLLGFAGENARATLGLLIAGSRRSDSPFGFAQGRLKAAVATWAYSLQE
jgi:hypothetical protein